jgi:predicted CoA-binding protein
MAAIDSEDERVRAILRRVRHIALIGASAKPERPSHAVMRFLRAHGYRVTPVNPGLAGQTLLGETVRASLRDIPESIDMVDVFRASDQVGPVVDEAIAVGAGVVWMQLGVINAAAAETARRAGLEVVMDRCPKIEIPRLGIPRL